MHATLSRTHFLQAAREQQHLQPDDATRHFTWLPRVAVAALLPLLVAVAVLLLLRRCCCAFSQLNACAHLGSLRKGFIFGPSVCLAPFALFLSQNLDGY